MRQCTVDDQGSAGSNSLRSMATQLMATGHCLLMALARRVATYTNRPSD
jgi:hypothetical protein